MIFKLVNGGDYSANVIAGTYTINTEEVYVEWKDANHVRHRSVIRERLVGSFDMYFNTIEEYQVFANDISRNKHSGKNAIQLMNNKTGVLKTINAFVEFETTRGRRFDWKDTINRFTVIIEEE